MNRLNRLAVFLGQSLTSFRTVGAVWPTGSALASTIANLAADLPEDAGLLEVGPGTGAITDKLVSSLLPGQNLTLVEANPNFVSVLKHKLLTDRDWNSKHHQIEMIGGPVEDCALTGEYDLIVCSLPFNNFEPETIQKVFTLLLDHLTASGKLCFIEYLGVREVKTLLSGRRQRRRLKQGGQTIRSLAEKCDGRACRVYLNLPPAILHVWRRPNLDLHAKTPAESRLASLG